MSCFIDIYIVITLNHYTLDIGLYHEYTLDDCNRPIYDEEPKAVANLDEVDLLVSKTNTLKGDYLIRIVAPTAESLSSISTYLTNLVDQF